MTQQSERGLTMLSRHGAGSLQGNKLIHIMWGNARHPLWTDSWPERLNWCMQAVVQLKKKNLKAQTGGLPTAGWYLGSAWPSLENYRRSSWDFWGSYFWHTCKVKVKTWIMNFHITGILLRIREKEKRETNRQAGLPTLQIWFILQPSLYWSVFNSSVYVLVT